jgi:pyruvate, water dikinase
MCEYEQVLQLARWVIIIEDHYCARKGAYVPVDVEWAKDGITGGLFIVQVRAYGGAMTMTY